MKAFRSVFTDLVRGHHILSKLIIRGNPRSCSQTLRSLRSLREICSLNFLFEVQRRWQLTDAKYTDIVLNGP